MAFTLASIYEYLEKYLLIVIMMFFLPINSAIFMFVSFNIIPRLIISSLVMFKKNRVTA